MTESDADAMVQRFLDGFHDDFSHFLKSRPQRIAFSMLQSQKAKAHQEEREARFCLRDDGCLVCNTVASKHPPKYCYCCVLLLLPRKAIQGKAELDPFRSQCPERGSGVCAVEILCGCAGQGPSHFDQGTAGPTSCQGQVAQQGRAASRATS